MDKHRIRITQTCELALASKKPSVGSKKPIKSKNIGMVSCFRCGEPSTQQWQICANRSRYLGICFDCDIGLNEAVLVYMQFPKPLRNELMTNYKALQLGTNMDL